MSESSPVPAPHPAPAEHYGEPMAEQRMLAAGRALVDLSDRGIVTVTGPDRLTWLDSLTSQSLTDLSPGESAETLLLDPHGRIEHAMNVLDDGTTTWLLVEGSAAATLAAWLDRMRFMLRVEIADVSAEWAAVGQFMPDGAALLVEPAAPHGVPLLWRDPWVDVRAGGWQYASVSEHPGAAFPFAWMLVPRVSLPDHLSGAPRAGSLALEALRIAAWRPRYGTEVDERTLPHELDWLRSAVHLSKGCYRGQETVAKVHNLGHPPRRVALLHLDGSESLLPAGGAAVLLGGEADAAEVGVITSAARHHELGPIALAVLKRSLDPAATLVVDIDGERVAAAQQVIVPPGAGAVAEVPRLPRLGAVRRPS